MCAVHKKRLKMDKTIESSTVVACKLLESVICRTYTRIQELISAHMMMTARPQTGIKNGSAATEDTIQMNEVHQRVAILFDFRLVFEQVINFKMLSCFGGRSTSEMNFKLSQRPFLLEKFRPISDRSHKTIPRPFSCRFSL